MHLRTLCGTRLRQYPAEDPPDFDVGRFESFHGP